MMEFWQNGATLEVFSPLFLVALVRPHRVQFWKSTLAQGLFGVGAGFVLESVRVNPAHKLFSITSTEVRWAREVPAFTLLNEGNLTTESYYWPSTGFCYINCGNWALLDPQCKAGRKLSEAWLFILCHVFIIERQKVGYSGNKKALHNFEYTVHSSFLNA